MPSRLRPPYGSAAALDGILLLEGEVAVDTTDRRFRIGDGRNPGGVKSATKAEVDAALALAQALDQDKAAAADVAALAGEVATKAAATDVADLTAQVGQIEATAAGGLRSAKTWAALAAYVTTGFTVGMSAKVYGPDAGTHVDPVTGATVDNVGVYRWSAAPAGFERIGALEVEAARAQADRAEAAADALREGVFAFIPGANLYNPATRVVGSYVATSGAIATAAGWSYVEIDCQPGDILTCSAAAAMRAGSAFYDAAGVYIAGSYGATTGSLVTRTAPAGAYKFRKNLSSDTVPLPTNIMFNLGPTALPYEAWHEPVPKLKASEILQDVPAPLKDYEVELTSPNKFDATQARAGKYLDNTGAVASAAGWTLSPFIEVERGKSYVLSGVRGRAGLAFYSAPADNALIAGTYNGASTMPLGVTPPDGVGPIYVAFNLGSSSSPTYTNVQFEEGEAPSAWEPPGQLRKVDQSAIYPPIGSTGAAGKLTLAPSGDGGCFLTMPMGTATFQLRFSPFRTVLHATSALFNLFSYSFGGVQRSEDATDEIAPFRVFGDTVGSNHGYRQTQCTVAAHGKTRADVGSIWSDGVGQWVINDVPGVNTICVTQRVGNGNFAGGLLSHVSGAANTASFTPSAVVATAWHPIWRNRALSIAVDDVTVTDYAATYTPRLNVSVSERYDILTKDSMVAWLETQVGTATDIVSYQGTSALSVAAHYVMDMGGAMVGHHELLALQPVATFQDVMFIQAYRLKAGHGAVQYLIPGTTPLTHEGVDYDFSRWTTMTTWAPATRLDITPARIADPAVWPDRVIMRDDAMCLAVGYLPVLDAAPDVRPSLASRKALQISEIAKVYMSCIDSAARTSLAKGDQFQAVSYRAWFPRPEVRSAAYAVRSDHGDFFYVDWHVDAVDRVPLPPDLRGRRFEVFRKTANVTVLSRAASDSVAFDVQAAATPGSVVLRFPR